MADAAEGARASTAPGQALALAPAQAPTPAVAGARGARPGGLDAGDAANAVKAVKAVNAADAAAGERGRAPPPPQPAPPAPGARAPGARSPSPPPPTASPSPAPSASPSPPLSASPSPSPSPSSPSPPPAPALAPLGGSAMLPLTTLTSGGAAGAPPAKRPPAAAAATATATATARAPADWSALRAALAAVGRSYPPDKIKDEVYFTLCTEILAPVGKALTEEAMAEAFAPAPEDRSVRRVLAVKKRKKNASCPLQHQPTSSVCSVCGCCVCSVIFQPLEPSLTCPDCLESFHEQCKVSPCPTCAEFLQWSRFGSLEPDTKVKGLEYCNGDHFEPEGERAFETLLKTAPVNVLVEARKRILPRFADALKGAADPAAHAASAPAPPASVPPPTQAHHP